MYWLEMVMAIKERDLYQAIRDTGPFAGDTFHYEIPISDLSTGRKKIDMVVVKNQSIIAIEVKINNWRKVLQQAYTNLYSFDYSYVALWHKTIPNIDVDLFKKLGIGVLKVGNSCEEVLKARRSKLVIASGRDYAMDKCNQESY